MKKHLTNQLTSRLWRRTRKSARPVIEALKLPMKKCCDKLLIPRIRYRASIIDSLGLVVLLGFFLSIAFVIAWLASASIFSMMSDGSLGERRGFGRKGTVALAVLLFLYMFLPKLINACSYLVDYKLKIFAKCKVCGAETIVADYPKNGNPF